MDNLQTKWNNNKYPVWVWEHSPEIAEKISRIAFESGYPISDITDAVIVIIGPSITSDEIKQEIQRIAGKKFVLVAGDDLEKFIHKAKLLFGVIPISELDELKNALKTAEMAQFHTDLNILALTEKIRTVMGYGKREKFQQLWREIHLILKIIPLGIITIHRKNGIISANSRASQILSAKEQIIGMSVSEFCERYKVCPGGTDFLESLKYTDRPLNFSHHLPHNRVVDVSLAPIPDSDEFIMLLEDVTEFNREREWLQCILSAIRDGVMVLDKNKQLVWSNHIVREWFGDRLEEGPIHCFNLWGTKKEPCPQCPLDNLFEKKEICRYTERLIKENGEERYFDLISAPVLAPDGSVRQIVQLARDVTDRELMIQELMSTRRNLESVNLELQQQYLTLSTLSEISNTLQRVNRLDRILHIILTAVTAREGLGFNRAFLLLVNEDENILEGKYALGPSSPEEAGKIWSELSDRPRTLAETLQVYQEATQEKDTLVQTIISELKIPLDSDHFLIDILNNRETVIVSPENEEIWSRAQEFASKIGHSTFAVVPLLSMTKPVGILIVDNMITRKEIVPEKIELLRSLANHASLAIERSSLTEELRKSYDKLEEAYSSLRENQEKLVEAEKLSTIGAMAAQVAHEIRNPLVTIGGFTRNLMKKIPPQDEKRKALKIILEESKRLEEIINDVLGYAKLSSQKLETGDINEAIHNAVILFEPEYEENDIEVEFLPSNKIPPINFDHNQIRQVFINLIRNSLGVLPAGGKITIKTKKDGKYCWIEFSDNGPGIPQDIGDKIFKPFFTTRTSGTGLGLSISARIIESHNGTIWYKNNPAGGVTFYIRLPLEIELPESNRQQ